MPGDTDRFLAIAAEFGAKGAQDRLERERLRMLTRQPMALVDQVNAAINAGSTGDLYRRTAQYKANEAAEIVHDYNLQRTAEEAEAKRQHDEAMQRWREYDAAEAAVQKEMAARPALEGPTAALRR